MGDTNELIKRRIMIKVAYDGTDFHGWQFQKGQRTVEGVLNEALTETLKEDIEVIGASRTDAGVHSMGNIAVFDTCGRIPAEKVPYALNQKLPGDVRVVAGYDVAPDFHPRKCDTKKTYEYHIFCSPFDNPLKSRYAHWTYESLDENRMDEAGKYLEGEHDFTSFCSVNTQSESKVRTIYNVNVRRAGDEIIISVTGSGFLYNMVRIIAGNLMEVGSGKKEPESIKQILEAKGRTAGGITAPAKGLVLKEYEFIENPVIKIVR